MAIDLRQLRFLVAVSETGSISGAARMLYMTQPAVTIALRNLERDVGAALLARHSRGVDLTPAGAAFLGQAKLALEHVDEATRGARQLLEDEHSGRLTVGLLPATFSELPRILVDAFRTERPAVRINYRELTYIGHTRDLLTGHADVAFLWPPYDEPALRFQPLSSEPRLLGVADHHPLADRDVVKLDDILDLRYPGFHPASSGGWFSRWFFSDIREAAPAITDDETTTPFEMALIVQDGRAIAPAAESFARTFITDRVRWLTISDAPPATLALAWNPRNPNPAIQDFARISQAILDAEMPVATAVPADPQGSAKP